MNTSPSYTLRLLLCAALTTGALACGGAEAEQGAQGPQGPLGEQGEPGEAGQPGTDGEDGDDGDDGTDGEAGLNSLVITESVEPGEVCANGGVTVSVGIDDNGDDVLDEDEVDASETVCNQNDGANDLCDEAFAITGVTGADQALYQGQESAPITVATNDDANVSLAFVGGDALEPSLASNTSFTITPQELGEVEPITVVAAGQCGTDVVTLTFGEVEPYLSYVRFVHIFPGAGEIDFALSGSTESEAALTFGSTASLLELEPGTASFDVLEEGSSIGTSDDFTFEPAVHYTVVAHGTGGALDFTLLEDDLSAPADEDSASLRLVHLAEIAGPVDVSTGPDIDNLATLVSALPVGAVGDFADYLVDGFGAIQLNAGGVLLDFEDGVDSAIFPGDIANIFAFETAQGNVRLLVQYLNFASAVELVSSSPSTTLFDFEDGTLPTEFVTGGVLPWEITDGSSSEGTYALTSGGITHSERSELEITLEFDGPGTFVFDWNVDSERTFTFYDGLVFCDSAAADCSFFDAYVTRIHGDLDWSTVSYDIPEAGIYTFSWIYVKDSSASGGSDQGWIDNLRFAQPEHSFL
ncbi:DUF4397 domain-containing protein [Lujinxingia vulgaris]|uniref:DUF4397 domain-containing protein n=1 Tax=Lujinxingia vulgaris TaxID=2600176 RepID=A0A5C6XF40_9DELT|nr:DUF4397 domain-containing protein [Lujinxingia vulgaris]TXD36734.1 DUF4397 domain-containing protein [Lujinxingia vulgaris]